MRVDLRSDTVTRPTPAMRRAMAEAPVGDDVFGDDPTVNRLEAVAAERSGKEAALFVPSGTMGNQIAIRVHTRPGDEILAHADSHPFNWEAGGAAAIAGVQIRPLPGPRGILDVDSVLGAIRAEDPHIAPATLLTVEDTANRGGGTVYALERLDALTRAAHERGLATHLDGARAFNAVVASGVPLARRAAGFDTLSFCLSKGLGCPVGSLLCGPRDLIHVARRVRKMLGGGMRQAGILAAAGLHALEHHVDRLADVHARAQRLAQGARELGFTADDPDTNLVFITAMGRSGEVTRQLKERGIGTGAVSPDTVRLAVHLDVDDAGIDATLQALSEITAGWR
jgi:threonine aldolase